MRTDKHIVADSDVTQYTREGPDLDAAPYGGVTLTGGISRYASCPQYHTSEDVTVITDYRCLANDRAMPMVQMNRLPILHLGWISAPDRSFPREETRAR